MPSVTCWAVLFDLDGVLVDSSACIRRHWINWAAANDVDAIALLAPHLDAEREAELFADREAADTTGVVVMDGAADLLAAIPGDRWAIATSCSRRLAEARLAAAGLDAPAVVVPGDEVACGKPDPECYLAAAAALGVEPSRCLVLEDAAAGIEAARRGGMRVIGVDHGDADEVAGADAVVTSLRQLVVTAGAGEALVVEIR